MVLYRYVASQIASMDSCFLILGELYLVVRSLTIYLNNSNNIMEVHS